MEKKYYTSKAYLVLSIFIFVYGLLCCTITPFIDPSFFNSLMKGVLIAVGLMAIGVCIWFTARLYYPVLDKNGLYMRHPMIGSLTKTYRYSDIHYATINIQESNKGGQSLRLFIELDTGEQINYTLLTDLKQKDELASELKERGVSDRPVRNRKIIRGDETVFKSTGAIAVYFSLAMMVLAMFGMIILMIRDNGSWNNADKWGCIGLAVLALGFAMFILLMMNYVILGHDKITIKNAFFPFRTLELYYSDLSDIDITPQTVFIGVLKDKRNGKPQKRQRILGALSTTMIDSLKAELNTIIQQGQES